MLRISRYEAPEREGTLNVEGKFTGPWVQQVREACDELLSERGRVVLELQSVDFIDRDGVELLASLRRDPRVEITSVSPFVAEAMKGAGQ